MQVVDEKQDFSLHGLNCCIMQHLACGLRCLSKLEYEQFPGYSVLFNLNCYVFLFGPSYSISLLRKFTVWLSDGEMNALFECKEFAGPDHLGSAPLEFICNKEVVRQYLDKMKYIPHIQRTVTMEPTTGLGLQTKD